MAQNQTERWKYESMEKMCGSYNGKKWHRRKRRNKGNTNSICVGKLRAELEEKESL